MKKNDYPGQNSDDHWILRTEGSRRDTLERSQRGRRKAENQVGAVSQMLRSACFKEDIINNVGESF